MKKARLNFGAQQHPSLEPENTIDSIMIFPRSSGELNAGEYSKTSPPKVQLRITSAHVNNQGVEYETKMLGNEERYHLIYKINNYNDSPAFAWILKQKSN